MIAETNAERQRKLRARRTEEARANRAAGLVRVCVWLHSDDAAALREAAAKLAKRRERSARRVSLDVNTL